MIDGIEYVPKVTVEEKKEFDYTTIKFLEDACRYFDDDTSRRPQETTDEWAYRMLKMIALVVNNGWTPDWNNNNQLKWFPWFNLNKETGLVNVYTYCDASDTSPYFGSRLCFESKVKAKFIGNQFIDLYKKFLL